ncbi:MAG TPA: hypothetical protein VE861_06760 [Gemmatimonadaceae bacterium]|nr:hypothetical protein [Gemmatimonadaceae bacterium]
MHTGRRDVPWHRDALCTALVLLAASTLLLPSRTLAAQVPAQPAVQGTARITGTVTDSSGAPVIGAQVTISTTRLGSLTANLLKIGPVFSGTADVFGVGHASFTTSRDGAEPWIVYHSKVDPSPGWNRVIRMQRFGWKTDGSPDFGAPSPSSIAVAKPSGECPA